MVEKLCDAYNAGFTQPVADTCTGAESNNSLHTDAVAAAADNLDTAADTEHWRFADAEALGLFQPAPPPLLRLEEQQTDGLGGDVVDVGDNLPCPYAQLAEYSADC